MRPTRLASFFLRPYWAGFEKATHDPQRAQEKVLFEYLRRNRNTEYGLRYRFASVDSVTAYQRNVPIVSYTDIQPYMERMEAGENNVLTRDKVIFFGSTSGTTSKQKFIPVTKFSKAKKAEVLNVWAYQVAREHPDVLDGKILAVVGSEVEGHTRSGLVYGAESGHGYRTLPGPVMALYALDPAVFGISDYDAKYYTILRMSAGQKITTIATLNPNTLVVLARKLEEYAGILIEDLAAGSISAAFNIEKDIRSKLARNLKKNPARSGSLREALKKNGKLSPRDLWPDVKLIECWKAGSMKVYLKELEAYFGDIPVRDLGCLSTEARSSVTISDTGSDGVLAVSTNFYEFIPVKEMCSANRRVLLCDELEEGEEYYLVVTTPGGLYRYNIDDIIKVTGYYNNTPTIEFMQKGSCAVSIAGEKLYERHVFDALSRVINETGIVVEFFSAFGMCEPEPRYAFLVEFNGDVPREGKRRFLAAMETAISLENVEYGSLRKAGLIFEPVMRVVKKGEFEEYRKRRLRQGSHDGQFKYPQVTGDVAFASNFAVSEEISLARDLS